jgi:hypothetical protein
MRSDSMSSANSGHAAAAAVGGRRGSRKPNSALVQHIQTAASRQIREITEVVGMTRGTARVDDKRRKLGVPADVVVKAGSIERLKGGHSPR